MQRNKLNKSVISVFLVLILLFAPCFCISINASSYDDISKVELYPGGMPFGVKISSPGLTIVRFTAKKGNDASSAYLAGMREGDIIIKVNDKSINTIEAFLTEVSKCGASTIRIVALRNDKEMTFNVKPKYSPDDGRYKTGIWVKDSTTGIGTITFFDPNNQTFGGLGHAICDSYSGNIVPVTKGHVMDVTINGVVKGTSGAAGELRGEFLPKKIGVLTKNSACGVFGVLSNNTFSSPENKIKACPKNEVKEGNAYIWCTLDGGSPQKYSIKISNIDYSNKNTKNFRIKVTDPELIKKAGGIVQGMSGSPIIQNGRIIGAVTHVLINDPTEGYGIFIENMLNKI